jgi:hypothetical protein
MSLNLQEMSRQDKLKVMHMLWEDLAQDEEHVESPAWHADALRETEASVRAGTEDIRSWEDAKEELRRRAR